MRWLAVVVLVYAVLVLLGGVIGFLYAKSLASIIAGSVFGFLLLLSGYGLLQRDVRAAYWSFALSLILLVFFGMRFYQSLKWMPSGVMALCSLIMCLLLFIYRDRITEK